GAAKGNTNPYAGGLHWQSAGYCIWESFFCVGMCVGLLGVFRDRFNEPSRVGKFLADNAFAVYVFHAPVLVGLALALRPVHGNPFGKFVLLAVAGAVCTYGLAHLVLRRIPALRRVMV